jgi:hypothetical protein
LRETRDRGYSHLKHRTHFAAALALLLLWALCRAVCPAILDASQGGPAAAGAPASSAAGASQKTPPGTPARGKKLILKDGNFHLVREFSVQDGRVRYWSIERSAWEEIPSDLVDWDATHASENEQAAQDAQLKAKIHAGQVAERAKDIDVDRSLEIKPGLFLSDAVGMYALDTGKTIYEMKQSQANVRLNKGRETERMLVPLPVIPRKQTLEIPDARAALRLSNGEPEFFFRPADEREPKFRLLRAQVKGDRRELEDIRTYYTGDQTYQGREIEFQTWTPARGVYRYTVDHRLEPGEYVFVEMTKDGVSGYVWDFGIDGPEGKGKK